MSKRWESVALGSLVEINPRPASGELNDQQLISFIPMKCVEEESGQFQPVGDRTVSEVRTGYTAFRNGDVAFAKVTPCMENGKAAVMRGLTGGFGFGSTELFALRPSERLDPTYLLHFLLQRSFRQDAARNMTGAVGLRRVPRSYLESQLIPLPPIEQQRKIVSEIEQQLTRLDAGAAALRRVQSNLKRYRAAVLKAACEGRLVPTEAELAKAEGRAFESGEELLARILEERRKNWNGRGKYKAPVPPSPASMEHVPTGWTWASLDQLSRHLTSGSRDWTQFYGRGRGTFVLAQNVRPMRLDLTDRQRVDPPSGEAETERTRIRSDDMLVTIVGANTGDVCRVPDDLQDHFVCQSVALIRPVLSGMTRFAELYLASPENGQAQWKRFLYGQGRPHLSFDQLRSTVVPVPPLAEQMRIGAEVDRIMSVITSVDDAASIAASRAHTLRAAALQAAFKESSS